MKVNIKFYALILILWIGLCFIWNLMTVVLIFGVLGLIATYIFDKWGFFETLDKKEIEQDINKDMDKMSEYIKEVNNENKIK